MAKPDRLKTFVLLLASDQVGEVANAAAALLRHLKADGKDVHWLADRIMNGGGTSYSNNSGDRQRADRAEQQVRSMRAEIQDISRENERYRRQLAELRKKNAELQTQADMARYAHPQQQAYDDRMWRNQNYRTDQYWNNGPSPFGHQEAKEEWTQPHSKLTPYEQLMWALQYATAHAYNINFADFDWLLQHSNVRPNHKFSALEVMRIEEIYERLKRVEAAKPFYP